MLQLDSGIWSGSTKELDDSLNWSIKDDSWKKLFEEIPSQSSSRQSGKNNSSQYDGSTGYEVGCNLRAVTLRSEQLTVGNGFLNKFSLLGQVTSNFSFSNVHLVGDFLS